MAARLPGGRHADHAGWAGRWSRDGAARTGGGRVDSGHRRVLTRTSAGCGHQLDGRSRGGQHVRRDQGDRGHVLRQSVLCLGRRAGGEGRAARDAVRVREPLPRAQLKTGTKPVIYTTAAWWKACTGNSAAFGSYPLWIASYGKSDPALPTGWSKYTFWQHTISSTQSKAPSPASRVPPQMRTTSPGPGRQSGSQAGRPSGSRSARERVSRGRGRR